MRRCCSKCGRSYDDDTTACNLACPSCGGMPYPLPHNHSYGTDGNCFYCGKQRGMV